MRTTLEIDDDIYLRAKNKARAEKRSLGAVISELARQGLQREPQVHQADALPAFDVARDAPPLTSEMVRGALDDEL